jgi:hypothetical protein
MKRAFTFGGQFCGWIALASTPLQKAAARTEQVPHVVLSVGHGAASPVAVAHRDGVVTRCVYLVDVPPPFTLCDIVASFFLGGIDVGLYATRTFDRAAVAAAVATHAVVAPQTAAMAEVCDPHLGSCFGYVLPPRSDNHLLTIPDVGYAGLSGAPVVHKNTQRLYGLYAARVPCQRASLQRLRKIQLVVSHGVAALSAHPSAAQYVASLLPPDGCEWVKPPTGAHRHAPQQLPAQQPPAQPPAQSLHPRWWWTPVRRQLAAMQQHMATKADIDQLRMATKADIDHVRGDIDRIDANIDQLRMDVRADFDEAARRRALVTPAQKIVTCLGPSSNLVRFDGPAIVDVRWDFAGSPRPVDWIQADVPGLPVHQVQLRDADEKGLRVHAFDRVLDTLPLP